MASAAAQVDPYIDSGSKKDGCQQVLKGSVVLSLKITACMHHVLNDVTEY